MQIQPQGSECLSTPFPLNGNQRAAKVQQLF